MQPFREHFLIASVTNRNVWIAHSVIQAQWLKKNAQQQGTQSARERTIHGFLLFPKLSLRVCFHVSRKLLWKIEINFNISATAQLKSISISQRLRTYRSPNPTVTLNCFPLTVVELKGGGAGARTFSLYHHSCLDLACSRSWYPITDQYPAILTSRWVSNADIYLSFISIICSLSSAFGTNQCWTFIKPRRESNI